MDSQGITADRPRSASPARRPRVGADLWVLVASLVVVALNFLLEPQEVRLFTILMGLALSILLAAAVKFPRITAPLFIVTLLIATLFSSTEFAAFTIMAPVFCGVIAYSGRLWLTIMCTALLGGWGMLDPAGDTLATSLKTTDPMAVVIWTLFLSAATALGWFLGYKDRQRRDLTEEWRRELETKQGQLAESLHDNVASSLTSVVMKSETLGLQIDALRKRQPETGATVSSDDLADLGMRESLDFIAEEGRTAMTQLRELLNALTTTDWQKPGNPALRPAESVEQAIRLLKNHGFTVQFRNEAQATSLSSREFAALLPDGNQQRMLIQRALFEGTTNILKYAKPGSTVEFAIRSSRRRVILYIRNLCKAADELPAKRKTIMSSGLGLESLTQWANRTKGSARGHLVDSQAGPLWSLDVEIPR